MDIEDKRVRLKVPDFLVVLVVFERFLRAGLLQRLRSCTSSPPCLR